MKTFSEIKEAAGKLIDAADDTPSLSITFAIVQSEGEPDTAKTSASFARHSVRSRHHAAMLVSSITRDLAKGARKNDDNEIADAFDEMAGEIESRFGFKEIKPTKQ